MRNMQSELVPLFHSSQVQIHYWRRFTWRRTRLYYIFTLLLNFQSITQTKSVEIEIIRLIVGVSVISVHLPKNLRSASLFIVSLAPPNISRPRLIALFSLLDNQALTTTIPISSVRILYLGRAVMALHSWHVRNKNITAMLPWAGGYVLHGTELVKETIMF
jgi:hypothetical protein